MELNLNVDSEAINKYMAEKVIESTLGTHVKKTIEEKLKEFSGYNSPLKSVVEQHIRDIILQELRTTYSAQIQESVKQALDMEKIQVLAQDFVSKLKFDGRY
jgi:hypothetical protein